MPIWAGTSRAQPASFVHTLRPMVALKLRISSRPQPDFLHLPWSIPLQDWPDELAVRLPEGRHRHVVRFIEHDGAFFACKELPPELAQREFELLTFLKEQGVPTVSLVGVADHRIDADGKPLDAVLITRHLTFSLPYLHLFARAGTDGLHDNLIDALAILLVRIHMVGMFWGDCSLGNALFRRDAGCLTAYLVDTETGERHPQLSDGQRMHDLQIAIDNIAGGLYELEGLGRLSPETDPIVVVEQLQVRYDELWAELTGTDDLAANELWRIRDRINRLNDLGFDTTEVEMVERDDGTHRVWFRPRIVEAGHHRKILRRLTGIEAQENQARRLLAAIHSYGAWLGRAEGRDLPEAIYAYRWLSERYEPTLQSVPDELRNRLMDAEIYHQVLDHLWFLSEDAGHDVGLQAATQNYIKGVLSELPAERTLLESD